MATSIISLARNKAKTSGRKHWRDIPRESFDQGIVTGHAFMQEVIALARQNPDAGKQFIASTLKGAMLDLVADDTENGVGKTWAAMSAISQMVEMIAFAAQHTGLNHRTLNGAGDSQAVSADWLSLEPNLLANKAVRLIALA